MSNALVGIFGWSAALFHGDSMTYDRWCFVRSRLPRAKDTGERVLDVGCGTGAITMGIARRGYATVGLSWDERNQRVAEQRAKLSGIGNISFPIADVRELDKLIEHNNAYHYVICCEVIEHVIDDLKLVRDMAACLKPGGSLILTTPNFLYKSSWKDSGPWEEVENGGHVRRGYAPEALRELCEQAGMRVEEIGYTSFLLSQLFLRFQNLLSIGLGNRAVWAICIIPRAFAVIFDSSVGRMLSYVAKWPGYSITLVAFKPRFEEKPILLVDRKYREIRV